MFHLNILCFAHNGNGNGNGDICDSSDICYNKNDFKGLNIILYLTF